MKRNGCSSKGNHRNAHNNPYTFERNAIGDGSKDATGEGQLHSLADPPACQQGRTRGTERVQTERQSAPNHCACHGGHAEPRGEPPNVKSADKPEQANSEYQEREIPQWDSAKRDFRRKQKRAWFNVKMRKQSGMKEQVDP